MKSVKTLTAFSVFSLVAGVAAPAYAITLDFPSSDSTLNTTNPDKNLFNAGHFIEETFTNTGLSSVSSIEYSFNLSANFLQNGGFANFDVSLNSTVVDSFTINEGDGLQFMFSETLDPVLQSPNGNYTIRFELTNDIPSGGGSVQFDDLDNPNNQVTLTAPSNQPIPFEAEGTMGLVVLGSYLFYRKKQQQNANS